MPLWLLWQNLPGVRRASLDLRGSGSDDEDSPRMTREQGEHDQELLEAAELCFTDYVDHRVDNGTEGASRDVRVM